ncbi:hypothetical protein MAR_036591 [Mya arenaria]|uniref:Uncharacterized protein n=1 Tax=Mya arenaria TaxID=6604 RepID=A0ABY7FMW0_MYAAR|nr:hypothetical protein MAR_036591 [Mya arenaria]
MPTHTPTRSTRPARHFLDLYPTLFYRARSQHDKNTFEGNNMEVQQQALYIRWLIVAIQLATIVAEEEEQEDAQAENKACNPDILHIQHLFRWPFLYNDLLTRLLLGVKCSRWASNIEWHIVIFGTYGNLRSSNAAMEMTEGPDRQGPVEGSVVEGLQPPDRFILDVLKLCPHVAKLDLYMKTITDRAARSAESIRDFEGTRTGNMSVMSVTELVCVVPDPSSLVTLNISGCVNISPSDLQTDLLPKSCRNLSHLGLNMAGLRKLTLDLCPDLVEQELFDPLIYGRSITRLQGLENIVAHNLPPPFANGVGLPCLEELKCLNLCGLHGDVMSKCLGEFQCLTYLEFEHCAFLTQLRVCGWAKIKTVKFIGCCNLKKLDISNVPNLHYLYLKGCSMMDHCSIDAQNLSHLDTSGTNYRHLCVASNKLETLQVNGICTQESHTFSLRCNNLQDLSISKCDRLSDQVVNAVFSGCPNLSFIYILGSLIIRSLTLPASLTKCSLTGHRLLANIHVSPQNRIQHLTLNNLPKFIPSQRAELLRRCEGSLQELEVRAIPGETTLRLTLPELSALTLDQGIHLQSLDISCPKLKSLRIQYCRKLQALTLRGSTVKESLIYRLGQALPSLNTLQLDTCTLTGAPATLNSFCVDGKALFRNDGLTLSVVIARQMI